MDNPEEMFKAINEALQPTLPEYIMVVCMPVGHYENWARGHDEVVPVYLN